MNKLKKFFFIWSDDKGLISLLVSISVLIYIIYPLAGNSEFSSFVTNVFLIVILFSGIMSVDMKQSFRKIFLLVISIIIILAILGDVYEHNFITHLHLFTRIVFLWVIIVLIFIRVFSETNITFFYRIAGSLTIYLLIGFIWANMFYIFYRMSPDSFHFEIPIDPQVNVMFNFIYFSFETLTTLGLGDIIPVHPVLKSMVILESTLGPLYLAVTIGRLVSRHTKPKP